LGKTGLDFLFELERCSWWTISFEWLPLSIHQKLGEIPFDGAAENTCELRAKEEVERMCITSIYFYLAK